MYNDNLRSLGYLSDANKRFININKVKASSLNDVVVLYDQAPSKTDFKAKDLVYCEVPYSARNFNLSLTNAENKEIVATTRKQLEEIRNRYKAFTQPREI